MKNFYKNPTFDTLPFKRQLYWIAFVLFVGNFNGRNYGTHLEAGAVKVNYKIDYKLDWIKQNLRYISKQISL